jgi:hypothetical protein
MHANPHATVTEIIRMNGRPRNSTMLSLERLEKAGLVEHASNLKPRTSQRGRNNYLTLERKMGPRQIFRAEPRPPTMLRPGAGGCRAVSRPQTK